MKKQYVKTALLSTVMLIGFIACQALAADEENAPKRRRPEGGEAQRSGGGHQGPGQWIEKMKENNPEEFERLMQLREDDPEAFRKEIHEMVKTKMKEGGRTGHGSKNGGGPKGSRGNPEIGKLADKYRSAETEEEKASIKAELTKLVAEDFDKSDKEQQRQLRDMEKRLEDMRKCIKKRQTSRDDIIKYRLEHMLRDPSLR